ncbi:MAG: glycerophosphodiester phosphodiesterase [Rhizobiaceae bacterium]|nr:glycerophosphodiester phosphodiesterase [Rhizobiaceae bacterium]
MVNRFWVAIILTLLLPSAVLAFDSQGHRGARGLMPENTLPGFAKALTIGVTTLELDVGITRDGIVVISHDPALNPDITRGPDGAWLTSKPLIRNLTFQELQQYDVGSIKPGSRTAKRFPNQVPVDGTRMPSLAQLFELVAATGNQTMRFNVETKINPLGAALTVDPRTFATSLVEVIRSHDMLGRVTVQSFDWRTLQIVQEIAPTIETVYLTAQQEWFDNVKPSGEKASDWTAGFNLNAYGGSVVKLIQAAGGKVWSPFFRDVQRSDIEAAHSLGLKVIPWTVNDASSMKDLIDLGVDGIITDYPDILREVMKRRGMDLPPSVQVQQ